MRTLVWILLIFFLHLFKMYLFGTWSIFLWMSTVIWCLHNIALNSNNQQLQFTSLVSLINKQGSLHARNFLQVLHLHLFHILKWHHLPYMKKNYNKPSLATLFETLCILLLGKHFEIVSLRCVVNIPTQNVSFTKASTQQYLSLYNSSYHSWLSRWYFSMNLRHLSSNSTSVKES